MVVAPAVSSGMLVNPSVPGFITLHPGKVGKLSMAFNNTSTDVIKNQGVGAGSWLSG